MSDTPSTRLEVTAGLQGNLTRGAVTGPLSSQYLPRGYAFSPSDEARTEAASKSRRNLENSRNIVQP